jgi:ABC-type Mn2+/Zn2+ transport system ATPase subunit
MTHPLLTISNLSLGFDRPLISKLNLSLSTTDRLIVYGANGSGKSTLLSAIATAAHSKTSNIHWSLNSDEVLYLQQPPAFHSQTPDDVETYLSLVLLYKKPFATLGNSERAEIHKALEKLNLKNMPLKHLSGGQRQKLKLAQGLLLKTKTLILDEPFNAVDQESTLEITGWLNEMRPQTLQILVLHDFEQIEKLKSPVLWIQPDKWELLSFENWFETVDSRIHKWMHAGCNHLHPHSQAEPRK